MNMPLSAGDKLGPYEILALIGAGGMGEVYRAHDPRLGRDVAIKVSAERFSERFEREARAVAALNHPNICQIYDVGPNFIVMEFVEGEAPKGPLPLDTALNYARQIGDALEAAHEKNIVHRDLKPANIKITPGGTVKVLDFGLAKFSAPEPGATSENSPTLTMHATQAGVVLGTAAYMSPEQARGKVVDKRADIWAFGVVLYEMISGKKLFDGEDLTETLASVVKDEPKLEETPFEVRRLLKKCLQKDPKKRLRDIGDAWELLDEAPLPHGRGSLEAAGGVRFGMPALIVAFVFAAAFGVLAFLHFREKPASTPLQRFAVSNPGIDAPVVTLSPDGRYLAFTSTPGPNAKLWIHRMDSLESRAIEGTDGTTAIPFWSPDSRYIVFGVPGKLEKVDISGGPVQVLCEAGPLIAGGFFTPDGRIVFSDPNRQPGLFEVPAGGGNSSPLPGVKPLSGNRAPVEPVLLPDGKHYLYVASNIAGAGSEILVASLQPGEAPKRLLGGVGFAVSYAPPSGDSNLGHLLFIRQTQASASGVFAAGTLMAQPFDLRKLELSGEAAPLAEGVAALSFSISSTGILAYPSGSIQTGFQLALFDRAGNSAGMVNEPDTYDGSVAFSPDASRIAAIRSDRQSGNVNLWLFDLARGATRTRFTFSSGRDFLMAWSPDGKRIAYGSQRNGKFAIYQKLSNLGGDEEVLYKSEALPLSWSGDGHVLLIGGVLESDATMYALSLDANFHAAGDPKLFVKKGLGIEGRFSPPGPKGYPEWIAYQSNESGRFEVFVRPFDPNSPNGTTAGGGVVQISTGGGVSPRWSRNGKELFYIAFDGGQGTVMSVDLSKSVLEPLTPKPLFKPRGWVPQISDYAFWDASPDGQKFLFPVVPSSGASSEPKPFTVVLNWPELLKK